MILEIILVILVIIGFIAVARFLFGLIPRRGERVTEYDPNRMTPTGETFGERKAYHDRGEFSPGEHAAARAIRESLQQKEPS